MAQFHITGDSKSLWNCTLSPGWTREEVRLLRLAIMKFGVGRWKEIMESGCLPGKNPSQLSLQCQRIMGQQSLGEYMGIHLDTDVIYKKNQKKDNVTRKNGCVINIGKTQTQEERAEKIISNTKKYLLSQKQINAIVLPDRRGDLELIREEKRQQLLKLYRRLDKLQEEHSRRHGENWDINEVKNRLTLDQNTGNERKEELKIEIKEEPMGDDEEVEIQVKTEEHDGYTFVCNFSRRNGKLKFTRVPLESPLVVAQNKKNRKYRRKLRKKLKGPRSQTEKKIELEPFVVVVNGSANNKDSRKFNSNFDPSNLQFTPTETAALSCRKRTQTKYYHSDSDDQAISVEEPDEDYHP